MTAKAKETITITREELQEMINTAAKEVQVRKEREFTGVWRRDGKDYASGIVTLPNGEKVWLNIFPNQYWRRKKDVRKEQPMYNIKFNAYTPKEG